MRQPICQDLQDTDFLNSRGRMRISARTGLTLGGVVARHAVLLRAQYLYVARTRSLATADLIASFCLSLDPPLVRS
jgi:hypothetical protein